MTNYAKVKDGVVVDLLIADQTFIDNIPSESGVEYVLTDTETYVGKHTNGGTPLRWTNAEIGGIYDKENDFFTLGKPAASWTLSEHKEWMPPIPYPATWDEENDDNYNLYSWNESLYQSDNTKGWVADPADLIP